MSATSRQGTDRAARLTRAATISSEKLCPSDRATALLEAIIELGDRVAIFFLHRTNDRFRKRTRVLRSQEGVDRPTSRLATSNGP